MDAIFGQLLLAGWLIVLFADVAPLFGVSHVRDWRPALVSAACHTSWRPALVVLAVTLYSLWFCLREEELAWFLLAASIWVTLQVVIVAGLWLSNGLLGGDATAENIWKAVVWTSAADAAVFILGAPLLAVAVVFLKVNPIAQATLHLEERQADIATVICALMLVGTIYRLLGN